ncbi:ABC transporter permease [Chitinilyticum piscinae]|uniref:ABC transporter permease n=1 Tax=Chitinilyticum piscinae TaxID=2866724 RepID=A0A8J7FHL4_9NEIS|nr:ABC transporter permease [Chitinilyticum piscinae]MBE9609385.1 ABC transporter permease [Chitinilyticum piscinae]
MQNTDVAIPVWGVFRRLGALRLPAVRRVLFKQIYFTANEAYLLIALIGFALGAIVVTLLHVQYGQSRDTALRLLGSLTFAELAPLLAALVMIARSSSAVASELANMRMHGEFRALRLMNIDIATYLLLPRLLGMALACMLLSACMALSALTAGLLVAAGSHVSYQLVTLERVLSWQPVLLLPAKSFSFGLVAAFLACRSGLSVAALPTEVPRATSMAVMHGMGSLFILDLLWALLR